MAFGNYPDLLKCAGDYYQKSGTYSVFWGIGIRFLCDAWDGDVPEYFPSTGMRGYSSDNDTLG